jgi:hypothetical protein
LFDHSSQKTAPDAPPGEREDSREAVPRSWRLAWGQWSAQARKLGSRMAHAVFLRWRRKTPAELEKLRRLNVNKCGRISAGRVMDLFEAETDGSKSALLVYSYEVAGVTYEAAQDLSALPDIAARARFFSGRTASVKYDPKRPGNSIIACEEWCGLWAG